jgi:hypothetical protein
MVVQEKVIAKPVVMYIGHIPIIALPFAVFPTERGRQSGLSHRPTVKAPTKEGICEAWDTIGHQAITLMPKRPSIFMKSRVGCFAAASIMPCVTI